MMAEASKPSDEAQALFVSDQELRRRINPNIGRDRFRAIVKDLEGQGFPRKHPIFDGRYWPKVLRWLDKDSAVEVPSQAGAGEVEDGRENYDAVPGRKRRR
jgi:hypothetical protein